MEHERDQGDETIAVTLIHAYKNPEDERKIEGVNSAHFPQLVLSLSSEVAPVINEYERTSTTVADCYIKPRVSRYLMQVESDLAAAGYRGEHYVMHSAGGVLLGHAARERPVRLLESGPAAGALAASFYGALLELPDLLSLDMGGTTAQTCIDEGGLPDVTNRI